MSVRNAKILVLGYSAQLEGGVTKVTELLICKMPELTLHPVLFSYSSKIRSVWEAFQSLLSYTVRLLRPNKYRIVLVIVGSPGDAIRVLPFLLIAKIFRKKLCIQFHMSTDSILNGINPASMKALVVYAWGRIDLHLFLSNRLMDIYRDVCVDNVPKTVIPNMIDERWLSDETLEYNQRDRDIVYLGRWSWEKGVEDLLEVMETIDFNVSCELYTDAPKNIRRKNCRFYNWVIDDVVIDIVRSAKLLVLPSYSEAYPTVLLEACASGTPFVATNIAGIPDITEESGSGIMIEPGDKDGMRRAIIELLTNRGRWEDCSHGGRRWMKSRSNEHIVNLWRVAFQRLLA